MKAIQKLILLSLLCLPCAGCADGNPWGYMTMHFTPSWAQVSGRVSEKGIATSDDWKVEVKNLSFVSPGGDIFYGAGGGSTKFDPAHPPKPYSTCHAGHCHLPDGSTRTFEEIQKEMLSGGDATQKAVVPFANDAVIEINEKEIATPEAALDETGQITVAGLTVTHISFVGTARKKDKQYTINLQKVQVPSYTIKGPLTQPIKVGNKGQLNHSISLQVSVDYDFLDNVDWESLSKEDGRSETVQKFAKSMLESCSLSQIENKS